MGLFVVKKSFDSNLEGKALFVQGTYSGKEETFTLNSNHLVRWATGETISLIDADSNETVLNVEMAEHFTFIPLMAPQKEEPKKESKPITREKRTYNQISKDEKAVLEYLMFNRGPNKLMDINSHMNRIGYKHWKTQSATGFVQQMIEKGLSIKHAGHGLYEYKGNL